MKIKGTYWILGYFVIIFILLCIILIQVVRVDPFFQYHAPDTDSYYYQLSNQRSQNNGIAK